MRENDSIAASKLKRDTFLHTQAEVAAAVNAGKPCVSICYQPFCAPCRSTKHYVEDFARKHRFCLIRIDGGFTWDAERAGEGIPRVQVHWKDGRVSPPLCGAHTAARIAEWLAQNGVITGREARGIKRAKRISSSPKPSSVAPLRAARSSAPARKGSAATPSASRGNQ